MSNWKGLERKVAKDLSTSRFLRKGESAVDVIRTLVDSMRLLVECKNRKYINVTKTMRRLSDFGGAGDVRVMCFRETGKQRIRVFVTLKDLKKFNLQRRNILVELSYESFLKVIGDWDAEGK